MRHTCPSSVPGGTRPALQCPWCKFTFSEDKYERLTFSDEQKQSDELWKRTRDKKKDKRTPTNGKPTLAAACSYQRESPSKSQDCACADRVCNDCGRYFITYGPKMAEGSWPGASHEADTPATAANSSVTPMKGPTGPDHGRQTNAKPAPNITKMTLS